MPAETPPAAGDVYPPLGESELPSPAAEPYATSSRYRLMLVREAEAPYAAEHCAFPAQAARLLHNVVEGWDREIVGALFLDTRNRAIGHTIAYVGTLNRTSAEPRGLIVPALLVNAAGLIVFHNHPSGDPSPSAEDLAFTRKLQEASEAVGLRLVDHIVLGDQPAFVSLRERGGW
jgi:DNA repair protein RadC